MFEKQKQVEFVKDFTSPVFGNVYLGKKMNVTEKQAKKLLENGLAKEVHTEKKTSKKDK